MLRVVHLIAQTALKARRDKVATTQGDTSFQASGYNGGTSLTVNPAYGVWAYLPGTPKTLIPNAALAGLATIARPQMYCSMNLPRLLPLDREGYVREQRRALRLLRLLVALATLSTPSWLWNCAGANDTRSRGNAS